MDWARRAFIRLHITQNLESACSLSKLPLPYQTKGRLKSVFRRPLRP
ncbi:hypothetical protein NEISICOT_01689 [Neisseria sicca ATCC 29256]|uniref:Uncharacterized protein n=1 Tax=Neisseria sicca ATCC 29256 TaxID=547045 RepID=C6M590_NEISI|nr:hypothetical protein [Neisseria sicca]EET44471.1 hypothetical protein NEISICOT_01689 [Neisseria sicca ATCC 29256]QMT37379.1 hypothetical protein H3L95_09585 [Neisseria sicca]